MEPHAFCHRRMRVLDKESRWLLCREKGLGLYVCVFAETTQSKKRNTVVQRQKSCISSFERLPATRWTGIFQNFSLPSTTDNNQECQMPGQKFLPHLLLQLERVKMAENRTGQTKKQQIFFKTYCFRLPPVGGRYSVFMARPADSQTGT